MLLKVHPPPGFSGAFRAPASKPETQRAILVASLAEGRSRVFGALRCDETERMQQACRSLGAEIVERPDHLEVGGFGGAPRYDNRVIDAGGSALVFRSMAALASLPGTPVVVTGDPRLRARVMQPLFDALRALGAELESICAPQSAPIVNWGARLRGGRCALPGDVSSQFVTALLFAAPFAERPVEIEVTTELFSKSYVVQSVTGLIRAGAAIEVSGDWRRFRVEPCRLRPQPAIRVAEDYTSLSYLLAGAALFPGRSVFSQVHGASAQGEAAIVPFLRRLGLSIELDPAGRTLSVENRAAGLRGDFELDVSDCPNILPTLAAIGAYVDGTLRVSGGRLTRFHKAPRVEAIVAELARAGVDIRATYAGDACDGFVVRGAARYPGGCAFSHWGDHRIFMSLFVASLRMQAPCSFSGFEDVRMSFPAFFSEFAKAGVVTELVEDDGTRRCGNPPLIQAPHGQALEGAAAS